MKTFLSRPMYLLLLLALLSPALSACPSSRAVRGGQASPQKAVVAWLDALDDQDMQRLVELSPPGLNAVQREELRRDLAIRLAPFARRTDTPFSLSPPEGDEATARLILSRKEGDQGGGVLELVLQLEQVGSKWYVQPPRVGEIPAT